MKTKILIFLLVLIFAENLLGQKIEKQILDDNNVPKFIKFKSAITYGKNEQQIFTRFLNLQSDDNLKEISKITDKLNEQVITYQQYYKNVKVEYGQYKMHIKN